MNVEMIWISSESLSLWVTSCGRFNFLSSFEVLFFVFFSTAGPTECNIKRM